MSISYFMKLGIDIIVARMSRPVIVDIDNTQHADLINIWSNLNVLKYDPNIKQNADCVIATEIITEDNVESAIERFVDVSRQGENVAFICITDHTVNLLEMFHVNQMYTYRLDEKSGMNGYFNILILDATFQI